MRSRRRFFTEMAVLTQARGRRETTAVLSLVSNIDGRLTLSTDGTKAAPGRKIQWWSINWNDGTNPSAAYGAPPATISHTYTARMWVQVELLVVDSGGQMARFLTSSLLVAPPVPNTDTTGGGGGSLATPTLSTSLAGTTVTVSRTNVTGETSFELWRSVDGGAFSLYQTLGADVLAYLDSGLADGTYAYKVRARNATVTGAFSNQDSETVSGGVETFDFYVSTTGNDGNPGTIGSPFRTILKGMQAAAAALGGSGKAVGVRAGTYTEQISPGVAGTSWTNKIRVAAYTGETVWVKPAATVPYIIELFTQEAYIEFDGINLDTTNATSGNPMGGIAITGDAPFSAHHIRYQNATILGNRVGGLDLSTSRICVVVYGVGVSTECEFINVICTGSGGDNSMYGYYLHSNNNLIQGGEVYDVSHTGIQIFTGAGTPTGNVIDGTKVHDIIHTYSGNSQRIGVQSVGADTTIKNVLVYRLNHDGAVPAANVVGISVNGARPKILNCTVVKNTGHAFDVGPTTDAEYFNNIAFGNSGGNGVTFFGSNTGFTQGNNSTSGTDPNFADYTNNDFQLTVASTADLNTGVTRADVTTDLLRVARPQGAAYDRGCYEKV